MKPKALFVIGPPASGKSTLINEMGLHHYIIINVDDEYERLLNANGIGLNIGDMSLEHLSMTGTLMSDAIKNTKLIEEACLRERKNVIFDLTGGSFKNVSEKKEKLEALGYDVYMIAVYVSPYISIKRNSERERKLPSNAVIRSWENVISNYSEFEKLFINKICIVNNNPHTDNNDYFKWNDPKQFMSEFPSPKGKDKTEIEKQKSELKIKQLNYSIQKLTDHVRKRMIIWKQVNLKSFIFTYLI